MSLNLKMEPEGLLVTNQGFLGIGRSKVEQTRKEAEKRKRSRWIWKEDEYKVS